MLVRCLGHDFAHFNSPLLVRAIRRPGYFGREMLHPCYLIGSPTRMQGQACDPESCRVHAIAAVQPSPNLNRGTIQHISVSVELDRAGWFCHGQRIVGTLGVKQSLRYPKIL